MNMPLPTPILLAHRFPLASFGLQKYDDLTAERRTLIALQEGYRNFYVAVQAGNHRGFARAVMISGLAREDVFICGTIDSNKAKGFDAAFEATRSGGIRNINTLHSASGGHISSFNMAMIDPVKKIRRIFGRYCAALSVALHFRGGYESTPCSFLQGPDCASIRGQWAALEDLKNRGDIRSLGVSNFSPSQENS